MYLPKSTFTDSVWLSGIISLGSHDCVCPYTEWATVFAEPYVSFFGLLSYNKCTRELQIYLFQLNKCQCKNLLQNAESLRILSYGLANVLFLFAVQQSGTVDLFNLLNSNPKSPPVWTVDAKVCWVMFWVFCCLLSWTYVSTITLKLYSIERTHNTTALHIHSPTLTLFIFLLHVYPSNIITNI